MEKEVKIIELTKDPEVCIDIYFHDTLLGIKKYSQFQESNGSLDYFLTRKILATMFNNMREIDLEFVTGELYVIYKKFQHMGKIYSQFKAKTLHPTIAFENVFLEQQTSYKNVQKENSYLDLEISTMTSKEQSLRSEIESKNSELKRGSLSKKDEKQILDDIKHMKGQQVDLIHKTAVAKEKQSLNYDLMEDFKERFKNLFNQLFDEKSAHYNAKAVSILNAQSYSFDLTLWKYAKKSKQIRRFFKNAHVKGDFCSSTYMKYYLKNLDRGKMTQEQIDLLKLYDYLKDKVGMAIVVVGKSVEKLLNIKVTLEATTLDYRIEIFSDEAKAIKWSKLHHVALVILSEELEKFSFEQFLSAYRNRVNESIKSIVISEGDVSSLGVSGRLEKNYLRSELIKIVSEFVD